MLGFYTNLAFSGITVCWSHSNVSSPFPDNNELLLHPLCRGQANSCKGNKPPTGFEAITLDGSSPRKASRLLRTNRAAHIVVLGVHGHVLLLQFHHYVHIPLIIFHFIQGPRNVRVLEHLIHTEEE